jgi:hypothetical protein
MRRGFALFLVGMFLVAPPLYRHGINWNSFFTYLFIVSGLFLCAVGFVAMLKAREHDLAENLSSTEGPELATPEPPAAPSAVRRGRSRYYKAVMAVGLSPVIPFAFWVLISTSCRLFGHGLGFACTHPGYGQTFWLEIFAIYGVLGWMLSLLVWGLLVLAGKALGVR